MSTRQLKSLYDSALALINLHGGTEPFLPELRQSERLVYLETDPVQLQVELHDNLQQTIEWDIDHLVIGELLRKDFGSETVIAIGARQ